MLQQHPAIPRNGNHERPAASLAEALHAFAGLIESAGLGSGAALALTIRRPDGMRLSLEVGAEAPPSAPAQTSTIVDNPPPADGPRISVSERKLLVAIGPTFALTSEEVADKVGRSRDLVRGQLASLRKRGLLGGNRAQAGYSLTPLAVELLASVAAVEEEDEAPAPAKATPTKGAKRRAAEQPPAASVDMTQRERDVLQAASERPGLTAQELARVAGYDFDGAFRAALLSLRQAGLFGGELFDDTYTVAEGVGALVQA